MVRAKRKTQSFLAAAMLASAAAASVVLPTGCTSSATGAARAGTHPGTLRSAQAATGDAIGSWTLDAEAPGVTPRPISSTMTISPGAFDRVTLVENGDRQIEVAESGSWTASAGGHMLLDPDMVTLVITEPGDISVESYEPENETNSSARLRLVGDRLVLEMLLAGEPVARYAYRRE